jgi:hypothetical protein
MDFQNAFYLQLNLWYVLLHFYSRISYARYRDIAVFCRLRLMPPIQRRVAQYESSQSVCGTFDRYFSTLSVFRRFDVRRFRSSRCADRRVRMFSVRKTTYHKQISGTWSRQDPAFVALQLMFLFVSSISHGIAARLSPLAILKLCLWSIFGQYLALGFVIATLCWFISNRFLRVRGGVYTHSVEQNVEWLYAFDVHSNAFFPLFLLLDVVQLFLWPLLLSERFVAALASNTLYLVALCYYCHVTFLGYNG